MRITATQPLFAWATLEDSPSLETVRRCLGVGGNPVSVHHSVEIRCQFIILARKDEPTPDYFAKR